MEKRPDLPTRLRAITSARVGLGRVHTALPTRPMLDFQLAHARARDAVHTELAEGFTATLDSPSIEVRSRASDRTTYLQRPDLGRRLAPEDQAALPATGDDLAIVMADGLSAMAIETHGAAIVKALRASLGGWSIAPIVVARQARVAIGDEIGAALGVQAVIVLIGERPGLSAPDSVGAYISWAPRLGLLDSERNCVSNIRPPQGLSYAQAAERIAAILRAARGAGLTGVALKLPPMGPLLEQEDDQPDRKGSDPGKP